MKKFKIILVLLLSVSINAALFSQKRNHGHKHHRHNKVIVKRSPYRPRKVIVYHPHWRPTYTYNRRWIFWPKHNFYWDNWRNQYVFWNGTIWVSQVARPAIIVNLNLAEEKHHELKDSEDDNDEISSSNSAHKTEYTAD
jgi:hypothetical protein